MNVLWAIIWFLVLWFIGWPVGFFCASWYVCCLPFEVCVEPVKQLTEMLYKGVRLPYEVAVRMKDGKQGWWRWWWTQHIVEGVISVILRKSSKDLRLLYFLPLFAALFRRLCEWGVCCGDLDSSISASPHLGVTFEIPTLLRHDDKVMEVDWMHSI